MKLTPLMLALAMAATVSAQSTEAAKLPNNPKIDTYVLQQLKLQPRANNLAVFVVLKEQADLSAADSYSNREERIRYVYDSLRNKALATQGPLVTFLESKKVSFRQYYIENMILVDNPSTELINTLAARADVAKIVGNPAVTMKFPKASGLLSTTNRASGPEQNLVRIGATKVWENYTRGEGIVVAGQDTGVQWNHPALIKQYRGSNSGDKVNHNYNWHDSIHKPINANSAASKCGYNTKAPCDDHGHGTHTMGTVVGDDNVGNQIGVAPKAQWIACKNMDAGTGSPASYIECFEFFLAPYPVNGNAMKDGDPSKAPHMINNSWGCTREEGCTGNEILATLQAMKKAGILVIASAGNDGPGCSTINAPPAWHTGLSLTVGAFDHRNDNIASFSSRGPSKLDKGVGPNISAPGVSIRSSVPGGRYEGGFWSGTSMAGPHVVGAAALLWSYNKNLIGDIDQTISILEKSAETKSTGESCGGLPGSRVPNNTYGYGLLNVYKAICSVSDRCLA